jgi:hypothetical protein
VDNRVNVRPPATNKLVKYALLPGAVNADRLKRIVSARQVISNPQYGSRGKLIAYHEASIMDLDEGALLATSQELSFFRLRSLSRSLVYLGLVDTSFDPLPEQCTVFITF